ncbi:hypothetical protein FN846DRAFT_914473 [Sphaerosporella brunnea]|uniref:Uncharacterized protein n=1 Tax=Sphaerosporella brunnea TaxID=1250544 RepID=A0A5J5EDH0_9PEZI|nr:hypothetical protein FN846DRAFT_914473 [Sphaerosporella brunnea]
MAVLRGLCLYVVVLRAIEDEDEDNIINVDAAFASVRSEIASLELSIEEARDRERALVEKQAIIARIGGLGNVPAHYRGSLDTLSVEDNAFAAMMAKDTASSLL